MRIQVMEIPHTCIFSEVFFFPPKQILSPTVTDWQFYSSLHFKLELILFLLFGRRNKKKAEKEKHVFYSLLVSNISCHL